MISIGSTPLVRIVLGCGSSCSRGMRVWKAPSEGSRASGESWVGSGPCNILGIEKEEMKHKHDIV